MGAFEQFLLLALAAFRVTRMLVYEFGPFDLFDRIRLLPVIGKVLECQFCTSVYVALVLVVLGLVSPFREVPVVWPLIWILAVSGAASTVSALLDHLDT